jgi:ligand-binding sensor domain-containing protein
MCRQNGDIFVSTSSGVFQYYPKTNDFRLLPDLSGMYVHHLLADRDSTVWMCTYNNGLWKMSKKNGKWVPHKTPFEYQCVTSFFQDSRGVYWVGNDRHGLMGYDDEMGITLPIDLMPLAGQDALDPTAVPKDQGLCVTNIIEDSYHRLWINTFDGIYTYNPEYGLVAHFTMDNGLPSPYFNQSSGLLTQKGLVLLGSYKGLVSVDPGLFRAFRDKLRPFLLNLYVNGEHIMPNDGSGILQRTLFLQKEIHLRADQSTFTIFVAAPTFQNEAVVWFRYRMNPNERWTLTSDMAAIQMHNLASGTYHVEVQASYDRDKWEGETTTLTIVVEQPVYLSFWAIVGYVCLIILGVILGMWIVRRAHLRRRSRHAKEMEARKKQLKE